MRARLRVPFLPLLLAAAAAVSAVYVDRGLPNPDEGAVLTAAARILRGGIFYRDIDTYPFPGSHYLVAAAMALFGEHLSVARWLAAAVYCAAVAALYSIAFQLLDHRRAALFGLSLLSLKFLVWPGWSAYLYSDVAFCAACAAIALALGHRPGAPLLRLCAAGVCVGLALMAKQNVGLYLGAAVAAVVWLPALSGGDASRGRRLREVGVFAAGCAAPVAVVGVYFASHGLLLRMIESGLLRPLTGYLPTSGIAFSPMLAWWQLGALHGREAAPYLPADYWHLLMQEQLPGRDGYRAWWLAGEIVARAIYTSLPLAFVWATVRRIRAARRGEIDLGARRLSAFAVLALAVVLTAFPRADSFHILSVYPLAGLLLYALHASRRPAGAPARGVWLAGEAAAVALLLAATGGLAHFRHAPLTHRVHLDRADVRVEPSDTWVEPLVAFVQARVPPGEPFFVYGHEAQLYFLTERFSPWPFSQLYPGQEGAGQGREVAELLARRPPRLVVQGVLRWAGTPELREYAPVLADWIRRHYSRDREFFAHHPPPAGDAPPAWVVSVLEPRERPAPRAPARGRGSRGPAGAR